MVEKVMHYAFTIYTMILFSKAYKLLMIRISLTRHKKVVFLFVSIDFLVEFIFQRAPDIEKKLISFLVDMDKGRS